MQTSVVSIVSDGASVMKKLGKISQLNHQLCYAHGVCDVLFKNRSVTHIAGKDYDYDDQDEEIYDEGFGIVIPATASNEIQSTPLNEITFVNSKNDNNNRLITLTEKMKIAIL